MTRRELHKIEPHRNEPAHARLQATATAADGIVHSEVAIGEIGCTGQYLRLDFNVLDHGRWTNHVAAPTADRHARHENEPVEPKQPPIYREHDDGWQSRRIQPTTRLKLGLSCRLRLILSWRRVGTTLRTAQRGDKRRIDKVARQKLERLRNERRVIPAADQYECAQCLVVAVRSDVVPGRGGMHRQGLHIGPMLWRRGEHGVGERAELTSQHGRGSDQPNYRKAQRAEADMAGGGAWSGRAR